MTILGFGVDMPAGLRHRGFEGYYVQDWDNLIRLLRLMIVRKAFQNTKILNVTNFSDSVPNGVVSSIMNLDFVKEKYGTDYQNVNYNEFFSEMDRLVKNKSIQKEAEKIADKLIVLQNQVLVQHYVTILMKTKVKLQY